MLKQHKKTLIASSVIILIPMLVGLLLWNRLPDVLTTHWSVDNQPDGWSTKVFAVFGIPLLFLAIHWFCLWITAKDPGQKNQSKKAIGMIFWMVPLVSLFSSAILYGTALGNTVNIGSVVFAMLGLMFMSIGNYLPKVKQNYTLGVKVIWALSNEENWNATHRFTGRLWVAGGLALILLAFFPIDLAFAVMLPAVLVMTFIPSLYSYMYYKKQCREGNNYPLEGKPMDKTTKKIYRWSMVAVVLILIAVLVVMFTGTINCVYGDDSFTVEASFYDDLTVTYDSIDTIELRNEPVPGTREFGFGSARLLLGTFRNEEFGLHSRYTYTNCECAIIITAEGKTLVLAGKTPEETQAIYDTLLSRTGG